MAENTVHTLKIDTTGVNLDLPEGNYIIHGLSSFGPWMWVGPDSTVDVGDSEFFEKAHKVPGIGGRIPGAAVRVEAGTRIALRTLEAEIGDFKQRVQDGGGAVTLEAATYVRIEGNVPFDPAA
jgi:hypothetical protein